MFILMHLCFTQLRNYKTADAQYGGVRASLLLYIRESCVCVCGYVRGLAPPGNVGMAVSWYQQNRIFVELCNIQSENGIHLLFGRKTGKGVMWKDG